MLIERLVIHENRRVALFVPKAARIPVWEATLKQYLPDIFEGVRRRNLLAKELLDLRDTLVHQMVV